MGQNKSKRGNRRGAEAFDQYYANIFGERWDQIRESLHVGKSHIAFLNPFFQGEELSDSGEPFLDIEACRIKDGEWSQAVADENGLYQYYMMDAASVLAPLALKVEEGDRVLDMCAAPGGKSLILAYSLGSEGELISNDRSSNRRARLHRVLGQYLPESRLKQVKVTGHDATKWCLFEKDAYDKILLDAPCSSERHVLESPEHLKDWGPGRSKHLALTQFSMLASALDALKVGGTVVYSTCALSPLENDQVVAKLFKKREGRVELVDMELPIGEETDFGWAILPDKDGWGPFYLSVLKRIS